MILTTSPSVEGRPIDRYLGVVSSQAIMGTHIGKYLTAGFRSIVGGRSKSYEGEIAKAVADVIDELKVGAEQIGGALLYVNEGRDDVLKPVEKCLADL